MTRLVYFTACTLDGFIADEQDSLDWLFEVPHTDDDPSWEDFIGRIGVLGAGRPLLPRRITSRRMRVREARQIGQRVRIVLDVTSPP